MKSFLFILLITLVSQSGSVAYACRYNAPIDQRIERTDADTVVLAEVVSAAHYALPGPDWMPKADSNNVERAWQGAAVIKRLLSGHTEAKQFHIGRSGQSSMCDDGIPMPKIGDIWVIYMRSVERPTELAYPLDVARKADTQLDKLLVPSAVK
jgi:hypothetical protein